MRVIAAGLGTIIVVCAGLVVFHLKRSSPTPTPAQQQSSTAAPSTGMQDGSATAPSPDSSSGTSGPSEATPSSFENSPAGASQVSPSSSVSHPQAPQIGQESRQPPIDMTPGSDQYPGSQAIEVDKSKVPDIGFPVATETYTTSDSVDSVIEYYKRRYPGAQVSQMQGQNIIAVERNGTAKVIAIGSNGSETRIAIVQPK